MKCNSDFTKKFMGNFMYNHFDDVHSRFFRLNGREINFDFLFPLRDSLDKFDYERFEELLFLEVDGYAYESYQNGFRDGVRHIISLIMM